MMKFIITATLADIRFLKRFYFFLIHVKSKNVAYALLPVRIRYYDIFICLILIISHVTIVYCHNTTCQFDNVSDDDSFTFTA